MLHDVTVNVLDYLSRLPCAALLTPLLIPGPLCMTSSATESIHRELHKHNVTKMEKIHTLTNGLHCTLWDIGLLAIYKSSHHKTLYVYPLSHEDR